MPPKVPPVADVGYLAPRRAAAAVTKRPWWVAVACWSLGGAFVVFLIAVILMPGGHGDGYRTLRVTARLVASGTGDPIEGARVLPVSSYDLDHDWEPEKAWKMAIELNPSLAGEGAVEGKEHVAGADGRWDHEGTRSGPDGRTKMVVELWTSCTTHLFGSSHSAVEPEEGVAALWIAPEGREPVLVTIERAELRLEKEGGVPWRLWGTYDLGTLVVPVGEPEAR